ncbi:MAG: sigma-54-dependent Fis family transcriptional regulator [Burkholderiaceae bacterium]|nr:sigma-54-dependent Fis family transcriptional regulator [Burkholderiaceae bacterium]
MSQVTATVDAHLDRILAVVRHGLSGGETSEVVARSWSRCINDYHLDPTTLRIPPILMGAEFRQRCARSEDVIECAKLEMTSLYQQLNDQDCAVVLAGADGVILHMVSSPLFARDVASLGFRVGAVWSEREAGTNGMGTCVEVAGPVAVCRTDHFFPHYSSLTCSAVPVYDQNGTLAAVLDVTSRSRLLQQHSLVLLGMTAQQIENRLLDTRFRDAYPIHFHSRPEFVYTLHAGKLLVDGGGTVLAANRSALFQLGARVPEDVRGRRLSDLLKTSLENLLSRSVASSFYPVPVYGARTSNRFFAVAQQPAILSARHQVAVRAHAGAAATVPAASEERAAVEFGDPQIAQQLTLARRVVARRIPILLHGETGVGKEVFAYELHRGSPYSEGSFVAVNCASLPESLIESELFGYRAGAFTGAQRGGRRGKILQADKGTLFLDEIGDMPLALQARLLRVLDSRRVTPLGAEESIPVDFQLISATHRDLQERVRAGLFREDLYFRLNGVSITLPPLRERPGKAALIRRILAEEGARFTLTADAEAALLEHPWPGNVRQLRHVLRTLAALYECEVVTRAQVLAQLPSAVAPEPARRESAAEDAAHLPLNSIQVGERQALLRMLEDHRWNVSNVAKALKISRNTLYRKLHKLHIELSSSKRAT